MPFITVFEEDVFHMCMDLAPDATAAALRRVTPEELEQLQILKAHYDRLQALLTEIRQRPEVEFEEAWHEQEYPLNMGDTDPYQDHVYCKVCRECITCNLRPCRGGGEHTV